MSDSLLVWARDRDEDRGRHKERGRDKDKDDKERKRRRSRCCYSAEPGAPNSRAFLN